MELAADYQFPAQSMQELNILLALYSGKGITFRPEKDDWKYVIDTTRSGDTIFDIISICVIARQKNGSKRNGWIITRSCDIHGNDRADKVVEGGGLAWFKVTSDGRSNLHCCRVECDGPYQVRLRHRSWDNTRLSIIQQSYGQEVIELRRQLQEMTTKLSKKRKRPEVTEEEIEDSHIVKKLRMSVQQLEQRKAKYKAGKMEVTAAARNLQEEMETMRTRFEEEMNAMCASFDEEKNAMRANYEAERISLLLKNAIQENQIQNQKATIEDIQRGEKNKSTTPRQPQDQLMERKDTGSGTRTPSTPRGKDMKREVGFLRGKEQYRNVNIHFSSARYEQALQARGSPSRRRQRRYKAIKAEPSNERA